MERTSFSSSLIRVFLSIVLIVSLMPAVSQPAFADDVETADPAVASQVEDAGSNEALDAEKGGSGESSFQESEAAAVATQSDEQPEARSLGFVYFGDPDIIAGGDQQIAVAVDDDLSVSSATLTYEDPQGTRHEVVSEKCADAAALFTIQTEGPGVYRLIEMKANVKTTAGDTLAVVVDLAKEGDNCSFEAAADMGMTLSTQSEDEAVDEDGMTVYALNAAGEMEEAEDLEAAAAIVGGISTQAEKPAGKFVIALDPGHGGSDPGAGGSTGLKEANVTYKIAQACKTELDKYADVEAYITRGQNEYVGLTERVDRAIAKGAKVFVSLHINSASATSAKGAEVWYPNSSSYNKDAHVTGKELSQNILNQLVALGLSNRGIKTKDSANGSKYSDGSVADYYTVINSARQRGIPGIIVEHAFISNPDEEKKLADDSFLKKLGVADATGIAKTYGLVKGEWEKDENGNYQFIQSDGTYAKGQWVTEAGKQYWIDENGIMATGVQNVNGTFYYFNDSGAKTSKTGWQQIGSTWYYLKAGIAQTGWLKTGGKWYWLDKSTAKMATGWTSVDGKKYFLNSSGAMRGAGWFNDGGTWYWITNSGAAATGWAKVKGTWYWLDRDTAKMATGWVTVDGKQYFLNASGAMRGAGWFNNGGSWYWITSSGAAATGWVKVKGKWYWLDRDTAKMTTGWVTVDGKKYFLNSSGAMRGTGWFKESNQWYWITSSGAAATGWAKVKNKWYYLDPATAAMETGWTKVNDTWYYLNTANGDMKTGWLSLGGTWYYLNGSGAMLTGWQTISGKKYYFDENGKMYTGQHIIDDEPCFFELSGAFVGHGTPIMGASQVDAAKMAQAYVAAGYTYPAADLGAGGAATIQDFCKMIEEEAKAEGVRAEVVWSQIMLETGWLRFGGDVKIGQFNFAGIGATGGGEPGNSFPDVRTGIRAEVQHLKRYASTEPLNQAKVDPRYDLIPVNARGKSKLVEWLGIPTNPFGTGWAADANYGTKLTTIMKEKLGCQ
ncbi:N-acetylmuramoyl-L-alanine amidase [Anaerotardibacter muris]|uniref:N-acetylmuramoyl-L-alanine amidase n=1 Tax=Anaerotardibacter muris TaxID=2941505 RepID=UPI00203F7FA2|nr:N-acetylmuramoyl-L-alanine amidase [Anaerotardibacter muris]